MASTRASSQGDIGIPVINGIQHREEGRIRSNAVGLKDHDIEFGSFVANLNNSPDSTYILTVG